MDREEIHRIARYLVIGGWNTAFGIGVYSILYAALHARANYLVLMVPANILAITNAYLCYKFFVFKTPGNYVREYLRCYVVYAGGIALGLILMYLFVSILKIHPLLAQFPCTAVTIGCSYIGHKRFSFGG